MSDIVDLNADVIKFKVVEIFSEVARNAAAAGYTHFALFPGSSIMVGPNGKIGVIDRQRKNIDVRDFSKDFVLASVGVAEFYQCMPGAVINGGSQTGFAAFKSDTERDALMESIYQSPFHAEVRDSVIKGEWKDGELHASL